jgi:hypothetical protein
MSITPSSPGQAKRERFEHGSVLGGKTRSARVSSQWKSTGNRQARPNVREERTNVRPSADLKAGREAAEETDLVVPIMIPPSDSALGELPTLEFRAVAVIACYVGFS